MQRVSIHEVGLNSVLAEPLCDAEGRILLRAGITLTPSLVKRLERWSITQVAIVGDEPETSTIAWPDEASTLPECWSKQFERHGQDREMQVIHQALRSWQETRRGTANHQEA